MRPTIVSPIPIQIVIEYNEMTNNVDWKFLRSGQAVNMALPTLVLIFCTVLQTTIKNMFQAMQAGVAPAGGPGAPTA